VDDELELLRQEASGWAGVDAMGIAIPGTETASAIADRAVSLGASLIVLGTRGRPNTDATLGSVSAAVLDLSNVAVLLVPPAVWSRLATAG
jgi:nucleotide-binding universal stress UspA family protein